MGTLIKWIFLINELFVISLMFVVARWDGKWKGNRLFSITLPVGLDVSKDLKAIQGRFLRRLCLVEALALLASLFQMTLHFAYLSLDVALFLFILFWAILAPSWAYKNAHEEVRHFKVKEGLEAGAYLRGVHEDDFWKNGMTYNNPHDASRNVKKRMGIGTTPNLAHKRQRQFYYGTIYLSIGLLMLVVAGLFYMETTEPKFRMDNQYFYVDYPLYYYKVPIEAINSIQVVSSIGSVTSDNAIHTDDFMRGYFQVAGYGRAFLCAYKTEPYLVIKTEDDLLIVNDQSPEETYSLMEALDYLAFDK